MLQQKIAIVGTSSLTENEERDARQYISYIIKLHTPDTMVISGGADGVDTLAIEIAKGLSYPTKEILPRFDGWKAYKERNIAIAQECDILYCISTPIHQTECYHHNMNETTPKHERTGACWTRNRALLCGKQVHLFIA